MIELWDTSALIAAARDPAAAELLGDALAGDAVAVTEPILLEYLNGARNLAEYDQFERALRATRVLETGPDAWSRALSVHRRLAEMGAGHQRSVRLIDLVIAAVAEANSMPVVHVDTDYDRVARITGQPTRWLIEAPPEPG
jgi:predicted nucleic acid-binding protein